MPSGGTMIEIFGGLLILEVGMISSNDEGFFRPPKVRSPMGQ